MRYLIFLSLIAMGFGIRAQHFCYTTEMQNEWFQKHPELKKEFDKNQDELAEIDKIMFKSGYRQKSAAASTHTIPVVFHILHTGGAENISDAQVMDAVNILNEDFNKLNSDTNNVVIQFKNIIGNAQIEFRLATKDPNGNCTNGIIRHWDANTNWDNSNFANYVYTWPATKYMNVYVVKTMGGGAAGYTYLPGSGIPSVGDAIVILSTYVGSIETGNSSTSRALTHEVGHWLNLPHTWGGSNQPGVACGDDGVGDTPVTKGFNSCNLSNAVICSPGVVENMQNYMDYAYCQRMFTTGQAARMQLAINSGVNGRSNLSTPSNLASTGVTSPGVGCIPKHVIGAMPTLMVCSGKELTLTSYTFNANPTSYSWTADNGAVILDPTDQSTPITFLNPGNTIVNCIVSNANGSSTQSLMIAVENGIADFASTHSETFDSGLQAPTNWSIINTTTPAEKWEMLQGVGSDDINCVYIPGETLSPNTIEILETPTYDFKHNQGAVFTFKYAYAKNTTTNKDVFKVQASRNCGGTWVDVWTPSNTFLATGSGGITNDLYIAPASYEWKICDLTAAPNFQLFRTEETVRLRFFFQEDVGGPGHGNRFYLDEVSFTTPVGVNELTRAIGFNVYPNPSNAEFNVNFNLSEPGRISYEVVSITGSVLISSNEIEYAHGNHEIKINENGSLNAGIYFLNFNLNGTKMCKKIVIE
jgi:PKD repeat protein